MKHLQLSGVFCLHILTLGVVSAEEHFADSVIKIFMPYLDHLKKSSMRFLITKYLPTKIKVTVIVFDDQGRPKGLFRSVRAIGNSSN